MVATPEPTIREVAAMAAHMAGLDECPRCQRHYLETDPATGHRYCLYAADCGYADQPTLQIHDEIVYEVTG